MLFSGIKSSVTPNESVLLNEHGATFAARRGA